jgi:hypothetical protein
MKQNKMYVTPKVEVIEMELQGFLCTSGVIVEPTDFNGKVMEFGTNTGSWN